MGKNNCRYTDNVVLYTGRELDPESGVMHYRNRYYHSEAGRFLSRDPIAADINVYRYCGNNPISRLDPTGEKFWSWDEWKEWFKGLFTSCDKTTGSGALECVAEICKTENIINYPKFRRDHEAEGTPEWKHWDGVYKKALKKHADALKKLKETCPPEKCKK